nr:nadph-dependent pterin aldehyde reductase [Quercus suber]
MKSFQLSDKYLSEAAIERQMRMLLKEELSRVSSLDPRGLDGRVNLSESEIVLVGMVEGVDEPVAIMNCKVAPYCASKWAIEGLTRSVAKELPDGMAVIALNPGVIKTDMLESCFGDSAGLYQEPEAWALKAATMILNLTAADNGASLTV